jgi:glucosamine 6-phosphate synthetase-like amidotransferase/phosphosugar isomerase protein
MSGHIISVPTEEDAFYKMDTTFLGAENKMKSKMGILHTRYASNKETIKDHLAHPLFDDKNRIALFHNGFIANSEDLQK